MRAKYIDTFSIAKWKAQPDQEQQQHTLSNCVACYNSFQALQDAFPGKPTFMISIVTLPAPKIGCKNEEKALG